MLALNNNNSVDSVIVFYIIPSFTHSSLVFFLLLNINAILKNVENVSIKVNVDQRLYTHVLQNTLFCVQRKKEMNTCQGSRLTFCTGCTGAPAQKLGAPKFLYRQY